MTEEDYANEILSKKNDIESYITYKKDKSQKSCSELIENIILKSNEIINLHLELRKISNKAEVVSSTLDNFHNNLEGVLNEMVIIQEKCSEVFVGLENREKVKDTLSGFIDKIVIPEKMIAVIMSCAVNDNEFIEQMKELDIKIKNLSELKSIPLKSSRESIEMISNLKIKCLFRIKQHFIDQLHLLLQRPESISYLIKAVSDLRPQLNFVKAHDQSMHEEITIDYLKITEKITNVMMKEYFVGLSKIYDTRFNLDFLITDSRSNSRSEQCFVLGNRAAILTNLIDENIKIGVNTSEHATFDSVIHSACNAILKNCVGEFVFLTTVFQMSPEDSIQEIKNSFHYSFEILKAIIETILYECSDIIGLLLSLSIVRRFQLVSKIQSLTPIEKRFGDILDIIWNKFNSLISQHIKKISNYDLISSVSFDECHMVTKRVSGWLAALYSVLSDFESNKILLIFTQLLQEWENFILIQASAFISRKEQLVYQIINYNMLLSMLIAQTHIQFTVKQVNIPLIDQNSAALCGEIVKDLKKRYKNMINGICDEQIAPFFGNMVVFIKGFVVRKESDIEEIFEISNNFASTWRNSIMVISVDIKKLFAPSYIDQEIKEVCFSMLINYYKRFTEILTGSFDDVYSSLLSKGKIVDLQQILVEIKKYR